MDLPHLFRQLLDGFPFIADLWSPHYAWAHWPYALLVLSMLMRDMVWLRSIAIVAGVSRIVIRAALLYDPVTVAWETALVLINVAQLGLIWWDRRHRHADEHEALLAAAVMPNRSGGGIRRLLGQVRWRTVEPGTILLTEGQPVRELLFVTDGAVRIERGGSLVAICSRGDFVGEMSFVSGDVATATVVADRPMRVASFDAAALKASLAGDKDLRLALEASFNRNLIGKLTRSSARLPAPQA